VVVVGPPHGAATEAEAWRLGLAAVVNPSPERGMSSSVAVGFGYAQTFFPGAIAALLWPVDHPSVAVATVAAIASRAAPGRVVVPRFGGAERARGGHPTAFGRDLWPALARCHELADGARDVVRADPNRVVRVDVDDRGVIADIDTPADLP
jgi:molybdenum cofactor cytidylyltransferase